LEDAAGGLYGLSGLLGCGASRFYYIYYIFRHVRPEYLTDIGRLKTARECWQALEDIHGGPTSMDIAMCMRELGTIEKPPVMDISMYCGKIQALCDKLARAEIKLTDHMVACFMLAGLATDPDYSTYVRITKIDKNLASRAVKTELLLEEKRIDAAAVAWSSGQGSALAARGQWRRRSYPNKDSAKPKGRSTVKCYRCGKWGHISYQCPEEKEDEEKKSKEKERKRPEDNKEERGAEDKTKAKGFISTLVLSSISRLGRVRISYLDSCASNHMTPDRYRFVDFDNWIYKDW
jgi:hypothetical protein